VLSEAAIVVPIAVVLSTNEETGSVTFDDTVVSLTEPAVVVSGSKLSGSNVSGSKLSGSKLSGSNVSTFPDVIGSDTSLSLAQAPKIRAAAMKANAIRGLRVFCMDVNSLFDNE
jgi:uncharacterized protein YjbI with pentapeptide repeats